MADIAQMVALCMARVTEIFQQYLWVCPKWILAIYKVRQLPCIWPDCLELPDNCSAQIQSFWNCTTIAQYVANVAEIKCKVPVCMCLCVCVCGQRSWNCPAIALLMTKVSKFLPDNCPVYVQLLKLFDNCLGYFQNGRNCPTIAYCVANMAEIAHQLPCVCVCL